MIEGNQPCICGHKKDFHFKVNNSCKICSLLNVEGWWSYVVYHCEGFKLNNLLYLEKCYEVNHK